MDCRAWPLSPLSSTASMLSPSLLCIRIRISCAPCLWLCIPLPMRAHCKSCGCPAAVAHKYDALSPAPLSISRSALGISAPHLVSHCLISSSASSSFSTLASSAPPLHTALAHQVFACQFARNSALTLFPLFWPLSLALVLLCDRVWRRSEMLSPSPAPSCPHLHVPALAASTALSSSPSLPSRPASSRFPLILLASAISPAPSDDTAIRARNTLFRRSTASTDSRHISRLPSHRSHCRDVSDSAIP